MPVKQAEEGPLVKAPVETGPGVAPPRRVGPPRGPDADEPRVDLTTLPVMGPVLAKALHSRKFQFTAIVPNQIIFWAVIVIGFAGAAMSGATNFATAITWFWWFSLVFLLTLGVGRGWCTVCPFGGFAEWIQRRTFWGRTQKSLGLGRKMPASLAKHGLVISAFVFLTMTWAEEFFGIPDSPLITSAMVVGIVSFTTLGFMLFRGREHCTTFCPLSSVLGVVGTNAVVAGFRPKDYSVCQSCRTKNCLRGSENAYGCPWGNYPATTSVNTDCGLCSECYKACPNHNIGLFAYKRPFAALISGKKNTTIAWAAALLFGLVIWQSWNALGSYTTVDNWLNSVTRFPGYPNPIDYILSITVVAALLALFAFLMSRTMSIKTKAASAFSRWFAPITYGIIPLFGADFLARVMPKFFNNAPKVVGIVGNSFGAHLDLANVAILPNNWLVRLQMIVVGLGTVAALYVTAKIMRKDVSDIAAHKTLSVVIPAVVIAVGGIGLAVLYFAMNGAE